MIKELIIHLGDRKTGSTSIQAALASKSWSCASAQLIYPSRSNHNSLANAIRGEKTGMSLSDRVARLRRRLLSSDAEFGVISAEDFEVVSPSDLSTFLRNYLPEFLPRLRLIAYIRPHAERLLSSFTERLKKGARYSSPTQLHRDFLSKGFLNYAPRMRKWRDTFGEKILFKPFVRSSFNKQDVVSDFLRFVFRDHSFTLDSNFRPRNESLCLEDLVMLRKVHTILCQHFGSELNSSTLKSFGRRMAIILASSGASGTKPQLHRGLVEEIISSYSDDAVTVDHEFFTGSPMFSALQEYREKCVEEEQSLSVEDYFSQEAIRYMTCWTEFIGQIMASDQMQFLDNSKSIALKSWLDNLQPVPSAKRKVGARFK